MISKLKALIVFFFAFFLGIFAGENEFDRLNFGSDPGRNCVTRILQDNYGFLWFATKAGLIRYDGYNKKVFSNVHLDSTSISGNFIRDIIQDANGLLWIATDDAGVSIYSHQTANFRQLKLRPNGANENITGIWSIHEDNEFPGKIYWIGTTQGLIKYDYQLGKAYHIIPPKDKNEKFVITDIYEDKDGILWLGSNKGFIIHNKSEIVKRYNPNSASPNSLGSSFVTQIFEGKNSTLWIATGNGLFKFDKTTKTYSRYSVETGATFDHRLLDVYQSASEDSILYLATWKGGVNIFNVNTCKSRQTLVDEKHPYRDVLSVYEDNAGIIWYGTEDDGAFMKNPFREDFSFLKLNSDDRAGVTVIMKFKNRIFVGTTSGLYSIEKNELKKVNFNLPKKKHNIQDVVIDSSGNLIVGTFFSGLFLLKFDERGNRIIERKNILPDKTIRALFVDSQKNIWVGTIRSGVFKISPEFQVIKRYTKNNSAIISNSVLKISERKNGNILIGFGRGGFVEINQRTDEMTATIRKYNDPESISENSIYTFMEDEEGTLYLGTNGGGLNVIDAKTKKFSYYGENDGLAGNYVESMIFDDEGNLWIGTTNGLSKFNPKTRKFLNYRTDDGLPSNIFRVNSVFKNGDFLYFGVRGGVVKFNPRKLKQNDFIPPIVITKITSLGRTKPEWRNPYTLKKIELEYSENEITLELAALNFISPWKNQYAYKLNGASDKWNYMGNNRSVTLVNLEPGNYIFKYRASNNDGIWNPDYRQIEIAVLPPFWDTWLFKISIALFLLSIIVAMIYFKLSAVFSVQRLRIQIAGDLHDEIGSSLSKLSMTVGMLEYEKDPEKISERIGRARELSRETIDMMSDTVWAIDTRNDTLQDLADRMSSQIANWRNNVSIELIFESDLSNPDKKISVLARQNLYLIFKEALHNAVKYSASDKIISTIKEENGIITLKVKDFGKGFNIDKVTRGYGLRSMRLRAEKLKANLEIKTNDGVEITISVKTTI